MNISGKRFRQGEYVEIDPTCKLNFEKSIDVGKDKGGKNED